MLISQGENQHLDFKYEISDARKIARTLVAFANTDGGKLLVGVKDNGKIAGVRSEEELYMIELAANFYCRPVIKYSSKKWIVEGRIVLEIDVESSNKTYYVKDEKNNWKVYIRRDDQNILANRIYIEANKRRKRQRATFIEYSNDEKKILTYLAEHKNASISSLKKYTHLTQKMIEELLINLLCVDLVEVEFNERGAFYNLKLSNQL